jgi:prepilin-type N-terminal cleavage/methylation domain-containing protein
MRSRRGFTLIELMVAITAGLFVAIAAFALARQGSRFFQQEARIANAQFSATLGFDRLRADIARAGFLSTANVQRDPLRCGSPATWPSPGMPSLAAIRIAAATPVAVQDPANGLAPDQITLTGSYSSVEMFPVRDVEPAAGGQFSVILAEGNGAFSRANLSAAEGGVAATLFQTGRVLRVLDNTGNYHYGSIAGTGFSASGAVVITLKANPALTWKRPETNCGFGGFSRGTLANVVNTIRYEIRDLKSLDLPQFRPLFNTSATAPGDEKRYELVRVELDSSGAEMPNSLELVAEYAVDLRFGLTVATTTGADPSLTEYPFGDANVYNYALDVATNPTAVGPERIRAVRARFTVRSREADRAAPVPPPAGAPPGTMFRYAMSTDGGSYARARSLTADIQLPNLAGVAW